MKKLSILLLIQAAVGPVLASDPVGIYAFITRAEVKEVEGAMQTLTLEGAFSIGVVAPHRLGYRHHKLATPETGYLYFSMPTRNKERKLAQTEWKDILREVEQKGFACVGLSSLGPEPASLIATLRRTGSRPEAPDVYRVSSNGLYRFKPGTWIYKNLSKAVKPDAGIGDR